MKLSKVKSQKSKVNQGFTFVELIVVIAIFSIMAGIVIFNARDFGDSIALQNLAQDIALQLKKAQNDGSSGRFNIGFTGYPMSKISYGLQFNTTEYTQFSYFADLDNDGTLRSNNFCGTGGYECIKIFSIPNGDKISNLCVNQGSSCGLSSVDITFTRPNLNATIVTNPISSRIIADAEIEIKSPKGKTKTIVIWPTGQISIK